MGFEIHQVLHASPPEMAKLTQKAKNSWLGKLANWDFNHHLETPTLTTLGQTLKAATSIRNLGVIAAGGAITALYAQSYWPAAAAAVAFYAGIKFHTQLLCIEQLALRRTSNQCRAQLNTLKQDYQRAEKALRIATQSHKFS